MMNSTENMLLSLNDFWDAEGEEYTNPEDVLGYINNPSSFRNFGEGLSEIIRKCICD